MSFIGLLLIIFIVFIISLILSRSIMYRRLRMKVNSNPVLKEVVQTLLSFALLGAFYIIAWYLIVNFY